MPAINHYGGGLRQQLLVRLKVWAGRSIFAEAATTGQRLNGLPAN